MKATLKIEANLISKMALHWAKTANDISKFTAEGLLKKWKILQRTDFLIACFHSEHVFKDEKQLELDLKWNKLNVFTYWP